MTPIYDEPVDAFESAWVRALRGTDTHREAVRAGLGAAQPYLVADALRAAAHELNVRSRKVDHGAESTGLFVAAVMLRRRATRIARDAGMPLAYPPPEPASEASR